jgi:hypothetical protein
MQTERFTRISETQIPYELQVDATAIREQRAAASMREQGGYRTPDLPINPLFQ